VNKCLAALTFVAASMIGVRFMEMTIEGGDGAALAILYFGFVVPMFIGFYENCKKEQ
jgi:hypothetical protein